jgi:hypothetical protein
MRALTHGLGCAQTGNCPTRDRANGTMSRMCREACLNCGVHGMDVRKTLQILGRRWYIAVPLLLLTVAASAAMAARPGPYQSESQVVLLPSAQSSKLAGGNPYLSFDDSLTLTADLLRRLLINPPLVQSLGKNGYGSSYQVVDDPLTAGPVLDITVTGTSKDSVEHTLAGVTNEAGRQLRLMQGHVAPIDLITLKTVSYDSKASLLLTRKARTPLVALAIGLVLTVAVPLAFDAAAADRRKSRSRARSPRRPVRRAGTVTVAVASWAGVQLKAVASWAGPQLKALASWAGPQLKALASWAGVQLKAVASWARGQLVVTASDDQRLVAKQGSAKVPDEQRVIAADAHSDNASDASGT